MLDCFLWDNRAGIEANYRQNLISMGMDKREMEEDRIIGLDDCRYDRPRIPFYMGIVKISLILLMAALAAFGAYMLVIFWPIIQAAYG